MNRSVPAVVAIGVLGGALLIYSLTRPTPEAPRPAATVEPPAPRPVREAPAPEPAPPRVVARGPAATAPEPAPSAAPAEAPVTLGVLRIDSDVPGAQVFIDREYIGAAPVTAESVSPGTHRINVSAQGYEGIAETIEVSPGPRDLMFKLREVRLEAKLDVVHKHRLGSCKGRLVATPRGVRYETVDKGDAFTSALVDLETFEVDYLEKNLRLKLRKGRQFNFTDPEGNADRIFVFHRDVEKARERLKKGDPPASQ